MLLCKYFAKGQEFHIKILKMTGPNKFSFVFNMVKEKDSIILEFSIEESSFSLIAVAINGNLSELF